MTDDTTKATLQKVFGFDPTTPRPVRIEGGRPVFLGYVLKVEPDKARFGYWSMHIAFKGEAETAAIIWCHAERLLAVATELEFQLASV